MHAGDRGVARVTGAQQGVWLCQPDVITKAIVRENDSALVSGKIGRDDADTGLYRVFPGPDHETVLPVSRLASCSIIGFSWIPGTNHG